MIVTMGCGDACSVCPGKRYLGWDPVGLGDLDVGQTAASAVRYSMIVRAPAIQPVAWAMAPATTFATSVITLRTWADTLDEVRKLLLDSPEYRDASEEVVAYLTLRSRRGANVEGIVGAPRLVDTEALSQSHAARFHRQVFEQVDVADAKEIASLLGPAKDTRGLTQRLRKSSQVVALKLGNTFVYPRFQFDFDRHKVRPVVANVNRLLLASKDPWGALAWWLAEQPRWGRRRPVDHIDDKTLVDLLKADTDDDF